MWQNTSFLSEKDSVNFKNHTAICNRNGYNGGKGGDGVKALITGATSGIGKEMALLLAKEGWSLILASRDSRKMRQIQKKLPVPVQIVEVDLSKEADCFRLYETVKAERVDLLINNAGFGALGEFSEISLETQLSMLEVNVRAVHILTYLFLRDFRKRDTGYILNVASSAGFLAGPLMTSYYATKNYVLRMTEGIYEELRQAGSHVHISALCPASIQTGFQKRAHVKQSMKGISPKRAAKAGLDGVFKGNPFVLPDIVTKVAYIIQRFVPERVLLRITYGIQAKKRG